MLTRIFLTAVIACAFIFTSEINAQICTPDTSLKTAGYSPDSLPNANKNVAYNEAISVRAPKDTNVIIFGNSVRVTIDSIKVTNVIGLPPGMTYECLAPRCVFTYKETSCVLLSGTPTDAGTFPIRIAIVGYVQFGGTISQPDTIDRFSIKVNGTAGTYQLIERTPLTVYPNPASDVVEVTVKNQNEWGKLVLINSSGAMVKEIIVPANSTQVKFSIAELPQGLYLLSDGINWGRILRK